MKFKSNIRSYIYSSIYFPGQNLRSKVRLIICFYRLRVSIWVRIKRTKYVPFLFEKRFLRKECKEHSIVCITALVIIDKIVLVVH